MSNSIFIMSFPGMGSTTAVETFKEPFDGEQFKVVELDIEAPLKGFVEKLKEIDESGEYDFVILPTNERLRKLMFLADIPMITVYPTVDRMKTIDKENYKDLNFEEMRESYQSCPFSTVRISVAVENVYITQIIRSILGDEL